MLILIAQRCVLFMYRTIHGLAVVIVWYLTQPRQNTGGAFNVLR